MRFQDFFIVTSKRRFTSWVKVVAHLILGEETKSKDQVTTETTNVKRNVKVEE